MEQGGKHIVPSVRTDVWQALNDPAVLTRCLDGCRAMTPVGENEFEAEVVAKVGPLKAAFTAAISLRDVVPLESYRLEVRIKGKGGTAAFANGTATVRLEDADGGQATVLNYRIQGAVGGRIAQIGSRLVDGVARKMTARFFERFTADFIRRPLGSTVRV